MSISQRIAILVRGRIVAYDTPETLYRRPSCPYVARVLGEANLIEGLDGAGTWLIRPEAVRLEIEGSVGREAIVRASYFDGADRVIDVQLPTGPGAGQTLRVRARAEATPTRSVDERVRVELPTAALWRLPEPDPTWL